MSSRERAVMAAGAAAVPRAAVIAACVAWLVWPGVARSSGGVILEVRGTAVVVARGGAPESSARAGMRLSPGDMLRAAPGSQVSILLDGRRQTIQGQLEVASSEDDDSSAGWMAALLGELERLLEDPARDSAAGASRAATAPLVLRGPVDTCVLAPPQVFSWGASPGVLEYAVRLTSSSGRTLASARVRGTSLAIADLRWRPAPGLIYDWSVMPVGAAGPSRAVSAWFRVLPPGEQKALRARCDSLREALQRQGAPPGKVLVGEALVWERSTVRSKAEELLEAAADAAPAGPWNRVARARLAAIRAAGRP